MHNHSMWRLNVTDESWFTFSRDSTTYHNPKPKCCKHISATVIFNVILAMFTHAPMPIVYWFALGGEGIIQPFVWLAHQVICHCLHKTSSITSHNKAHLKLVVI